jgi:hypothetical protein
MIICHPPVQCSMNVLSSCPMFCTSVKYLDKLLSNILPILFPKSSYHPVIFRSNSLPSFQQTIIKFGVYPIFCIASVRFSAVLLSNILPSICSIFCLHPVQCSVVLLLRFCHSPPISSCPAFLSPILTFCCPHVQYSVVLLSYILQSYVPKFGQSFEVLGLLLCFGIFCTLAFHCIFFSYPNRCCISGLSALYLFRLVYNIQSFPAKGCENTTFFVKKRNFSPKFRVFFLQSETSGAP